MILLSTNPNIRPKFFSGGSFFFLLAMTTHANYYFLVLKIQTHFWACFHMFPFQFLNFFFFYFSQRNCEINIFEERRRMISIRLWQGTFQLFPINWRCWRSFARFSGLVADWSIGSFAFFGKRSVDDWLLSEWGLGGDMTLIISREATRESMIYFNCKNLFSFPKYNTCTSTSTLRIKKNKAGSLCGLRF